MVTASEAQVTLRPWIERVRRRAYVPVVQDGAGAPAGSRFNGAPYLSAGEEWPACAVCRKPMPLFLQLDLAALPGEYAGRFGTGLLQLFYCVDCEDAGNAWEPFKHQSKLVRVIGRDAQGAMAPPRRTSLEAAVKAITAWAPREEGPNAEEACTHGLVEEWERSGPEGSRLRYQAPSLGLDTGWIVGAHEEDAIHELVFNPGLGDKVGGWPAWVQGIEYPSCPRCRAQMQLVFQIDSNDHVPHMFGDVGCGHITQCATHHDIVTFAWACS